MRALLNFFLFVLALAISIAALRHWTPAPMPTLMAVRLAEFNPDRETYDTLFFGSSRIFRAVDPSVFDAETARRGHPTRSFNFAFPGMEAHETNAWLQRVLDDSPANLRYVVIELQDWSSLMHDRITIETSVRTGRYTARALAWHDGPETLSVLRSIWLSDDPTPEKLSRAATHLSHWSARTLGIGNGARSIRRRNAAARQVRDPLQPHRRGFTPFEAEDYRVGLPVFFRGRFLHSVDAYHVAVEGLFKKNREGAPLDTYNLTALEEQIQRVRQAGATPIYLLPPRGEATPRLTELVEQGYITHLLDFGNPSRFPELFELEHRFDAQHLSPSGARLFSQELGERFAHALRGL